MDDLAAYPAAFAVYRRHRVPFSPSTTQHISFPIPDALPLAYLLRQLVNTCCRPPPQCRNDSRAAPAPEPPGALCTLQQSETQQRTPALYSWGRGSPLTRGSLGRRHRRPRCCNDSRAAPAPEPSGALRTLPQSETQQRTPALYSWGRGSPLMSVSSGRRHCRHCPPRPRRGLRKRRGCFPVRASGARPACCGPGRKWN